MIGFNMGGKTEVKERFMILSFGWIFEDIVNVINIGMK